MPVVTVTLVAIQVRTEQVSTYMSSKANQLLLFFVEERQLFHVERGRG